MPDYPRPKELITSADPTAVPQADGGRDLVTIPWQYAPDGFLTYDKVTNIIAPPKTSWPFVLPKFLADQDQPWAPSCSMPSPTNRGCQSWNGCAVRKWASQMRKLGKAPWKAIMVRGNQEDVFECPHIYVGKDNLGRPLNTTSALQNGWQFRTDKITVRRERSKFVKDEFTGDRRKVKELIEEPIDRLGPMYANLTGDDWSLADPDDRPGPPTEAYPDARRHDEGDPLGAGGVPGDGQGSERTEGDAPTLERGEYPHQGAPKRSLRARKDSGSTRKRRKSSRRPNSVHARARVRTEQDVPGDHNAGSE